MPSWHFSLLGIQDQTGLVPLAEEYFMFPREFLQIQLLSFSCCAANNKLLCFVIYSVTLKQKRMSVKQSRNLMGPRDSHRRSQEIVKRLLFPFFCSLRLLDGVYILPMIPARLFFYNATKLWQCSGDTLLCKQCHKVTCLLFVIQTKQIVSRIPPSVCARLCLHLLPTGYSDSVWALVTSTSKPKPSEQDSGCRSAGRQIPLLVCILSCKLLCPYFLLHLSLWWLISSCPHSVLVEAKLQRCLFLQFSVDFVEAAKDNLENKGLALS